MKFKKKYLYFFLLTGLLLIHLSFVFLPPFLKDELIHHLSLPNLWHISKHFGPFWWFTASHYPSIIHWIYFVLPDNYLFSHLLSYFILLTTVLLLLKFYSKKQHFAYLPAISFLAIPVIFQVSSTAYIDLWLVFISTASLFYIEKIVNNREKYPDILLLSLLLAISAGVKYNGWLLDFALIFTLFIYMKNINRYYFIIISGIFIILLNLPWLIMNYNDTGNPIYPLFTNYLNLGSTNIHIYEDLVKGQLPNVFKLRELLYHESPLMALLSPIRVFFYGQDGNPILFDGSLLPLLIIFIPFIKLSKRNKALLLITFIYFMFAIILKPVRARYYLPIIPFLLILSFEGFENLYNKNKYTKYISIVLLLLSFIPLFIYLPGRWSNLEMNKFISGNISSKQWKINHITNYEAYTFINKLPKGKVFLYFVGKKGYYLNKEFMFEPFFNVTKRNFEGSWLKYSAKNENLSIFKKYNIRYILIDTKQLAKFEQVNFSEKEIQSLRYLVGNNTQLIYKKNYIEIWEMK